MRIPDGDLVPRRRRSQYGGYGRRRRRSRLVRLAVVLLAVGLIAGGVWLAR